MLVRRRDDDAPMRAGYTVTKKIGNAVIRNRLKRRMRALVRQVLPANGVAHADHILIGRSEGLTRRFDTLAADLVKALARCAG
nr:ribonuclease P protein component [Polymorphobacter sp.]